MTNGWPGAMSGSGLMQYLRSAPAYTVIVEVDHEAYPILDVVVDEGLQIVRIRAQKDE